MEGRCKKCFGEREREREREKSAGYRVEEGRGAVKEVVSEPVLARVEIPV